jgi:uncharacterized YkwD family protein
MGHKKHNRALSLAVATVIAGLALAVPVSANHFSNGQFYAYSTQLVWKYFPGYGWLQTRTVQPQTLQIRTAPIQVQTTPTESAPAQQTPAQPVPVQPTPAPSAPAQPAPSQSVAGLTADEQQMLNSVKSERSRYGLAPLQADLQLTKLARMKSQDMISKGYFSHQSPTYGSPFDMMRTYGVSYRTAAENIAGNGSVSGAHTSLMNSSGHRANILGSRYTHVGIGIVKGGRYGMMFTQLFVGR